MMKYKRNRLMGYKKMGGNKKEKLRVWDTKEKPKKIVKKIFGKK